MILLAKRKMLDKLSLEFFYSSMRTMGYTPRLRRATTELTNWNVYYKIHRADLMNNVRKWNACMAN